MSCPVKCDQNIFHDRNYLRGDAFWLTYEVDAHDQLRFAPAGAFDLDRVASTSILAQGRLDTGAVSAAVPRRLRGAA